MLDAIALTCAQTVALHPRPPFHFAGTVHKPSHFPTPDEAYEPGIHRRTMRFAGELLGLRLEDVGSVARPEVALTVFSRAPLAAAVVERVAAEVRWRFDLDADLAGFCAACDDEVLGPALARWRGMRVSAGVSLYEFLVIVVLLQNATVRRTVQMMESLFRTYGGRVAFDGAELATFWPPAVLDAAPEEELRALKVGYRARTLKRQAVPFAQGEVDEAALRALPTETLRPHLLALYGVGPASLGYLLFEVFHRYDALDYLPPWERKIYSHLFYGEELVPAERILAEAERRWGRWKMLAAHYVFEDLFWQHSAQPIPWLQALIRL